MINQSSDYKNGKQNHNAMQTHTVQLFLSLWVCNTPRLQISERLESILVAFSIVHFNESNRASKLRSGKTLVLCVHVLFYNSACSLSRYSLKRMAFQDFYFASNNALGKTNLVIQGNAYNFPTLLHSLTAFVYNSSFFICYQKWRESFLYPVTLRICVRFVLTPLPVFPNYMQRGLWTI